MTTHTQTILYEYTTIIQCHVYHLKLTCIGVVSLLLTESFSAARHLDFDNGESLIPFFNNKQFSAPKELTS